MIFRNEYGFLSNFYNHKIGYKGLSFNNVEAAFQAAKCCNLEDMRMFVNLSGAEAKKLGRRIKLRNNWNNIRLSVMKELLLIKFNDPLLKSKLLDIKSDIVEENTWHDNFWGDCSCQRCKNITGENMLGNLLRQCLKIRFTKEGK